MRRGRRWLGLVGVVALTGLAQAGPLSTPTAPGVRSYVYTALETVNGQLRFGYRMVFELATAPDGGVEALVRTAEQSQDGKTWTPAPVSEACKLAMRAPPDGLARVRIWPLAEDASEQLGAHFLDTCAPGPVFFPLTDILNVAVIRLAPRFRLRELRRAGDHRDYPGFSAAYNRAGEAMVETSHGGEVTFASHSKRENSVDWAASPAEITLTTRPNGAPLTLTGTERWAFHVTFNARTGALIEAHTTYDDLDLKAHLPGVPDERAPPVKISRVVEIAPG